VSDAAGIPEDWTASKLQDVCAYPISYGVVQTGNPIAGTVPCVRVIDLASGNLDASSMITTDQTTHLSYKRTILSKDDVMFALRGDIGLSKLVPETLVGANLTRGVARIAGNATKILPRFLFWALQAPAFRAKLIQSASGSALQEVSISTLRNLSVLLPPREEQRKIADILSTWDEAIEQQTRLLELKSERKRGLMQQLLTGKVRFKEFEGLEWSNVALQEVADVFMGSSPSSTAYNEDKVGLPLLQGNADIKNRRSKPKVWTTEVTRECQIGDILVSVRAPVGTVSLSLHHACIGRGIAAVRARPSVTVQDYLYQYLVHLEPAWARLSQGSTFEAVNSKDLKGLPLTVPESLEEQQKIAAVLSVADSELEILEVQLSALRTQKRGLMQQLLTGKTRVKVAQEGAAD
jgi:type I restriction enzyme S subunit